MTGRTASMTVDLKSRDISRKIKKAQIYAFLGFFTLIQLFPLYWLILFSFKTNREIFNGNIIGLPENFLWKNYTTALFGGDVGLYLFNSILVTFATVVFTVILASMAAYAITRMKWKLSKTVLIIFLMGMMVPLHSALLPLFLVLKKLRILNSYAALIIPYTAFSLPIAIFIFTGFFQTIPIEMEESAFMEGCSVYRSFVSIIFPLIKPAIATVSIFTYLTAWNELMFAVTFISKKQFSTLSVGIISLTSRFRTEWGPIGAALVIAVIPSLLVYFLLSRQVQDSIRAGAIKG